MGKLNDLQEIRQTIEQGGGTDKIKKQHDNGKKTARERLEMLFDQGSFVEVDAFVTQRFDNADGLKDVPAEGVIIGYGMVEGRIAYAYSQDYTVVNGSVGEMHAAKISKIMDMALKMGAPIVSVLDSDGARIKEGLDALKGYGEIFRKSANASGVIPQIAVVLGQCAGGATFATAMADFTFMVDKISHMYVNGPSVIKGATNDDITADSLGGAETHASKSGIASFTASSEDECFAQVRELISYLPSNNLEVAPEYEASDDINRVSAALDELADDGAAYSMATVIAEVVDNGVFTEVFSKFAQNIITGFARLDGIAVGIVANRENGELSSAAFEKAARFVRFCDSFSIPVITFTDVSGYVVDKEEEYNGIIRHGAKLLYAFAEASVAKINVIVKKAYGSAYVAMNSKHIGADMVFAWPSAEISVMGAEGAANIVFEDDIANSDSPMQTRNDKIAEYKEKYASPYMAAARGYVDDVIEPSVTRQRLINALEMLASKRENRPAKKHGNIPM